MARKTPPNAPCPCGSGKKYKRCCRPALLANNAPQKTEEEQRWEALLRAPENSLRLSASPWFVAAGLPQGAPESWLTLAHTALQRVQPALAMEALRQLPALTLSPREHWRAASLWWDCQEPANAHVHLLQTSPEHSDERSYWKLALDLHVALEQWQEALQAGQFLRSSNPGPETWWKLLLAAAQSGSRAHFCQLCEEAAERTGQHLWYILEANALAAWEQHEAAAALYKDHLEAALGEPAHRFGPLEQALIQATRAQTTYAPDDLQDRSRLLCARHLREEDLLKQRIEFCVQLDLWPSITEDARQWLVLDQDSLEARFFLTFSSLMQQTITPQEWQALLHLASTELFPVSLWNWFLLRLLLHRLHREAWALLQPLEARDPEQTRMLRMIILSQQGQFPQLVAELRPHVEDMAPDSFLLLLWGQGLLRTGKTRECIEVLVPFWETSSGEHRVSYSLWLAEAALVEEQTDLAGKFLAGVESLPAEERPPVFWYLSGLLKTQQGNASEASDDYLELVKRVQEPWAIEVAIPSLFLSGRAVEAKTLLEDWEGRLPMHDQLWYALLLARWMTEDIPGALRAAAEIEQSWLENNRLEERVLEILASSHAHLQQWMEVFSVCERYQQLLEQRPQVEEQPLQEIHRWRREAARGLLLQQEDETTASESFRSGPWEERLREKIREEVLAQQAESHEAIAMKQALLEAERHQFTTLLDLLSGPSSHGKPPLSKRLLQLRESTLTRVRSLPPEESEKAKELQEQYLLSLQQIVAEYQEGRLGDGIFLQTWGEERWNRLPTNARQLLQSAEVLYSLLEAQPGQDHAPILMQWARAAEVVCNLRLADNLASFALKKGLSLHELPSFGGRPLEKAGNQLSLGAFPYLLAERWKKREGGVMKDAFNHQWTDSLQRLWEEVEASMKEARVGEEQRRYLFEELPSECQRWALWRNQFSHAAGSLHREELDKLREELLLSTQNLFTMVSTLPVL